jgi:hypothetical protein
MLHGVRQELFDSDAVAAYEEDAIGIEGALEGLDARSVRRRAAANV